MSTPRSIDRYTTPAIALHWLIALLIFAGFGLGVTMTDIPGLTPTKLRYYSYHKWIGVTVFLLVVLRVAWRLTHRPPVLPPMSWWQRMLANTVHVTLYGLLLVIPLAGYLYSYAAGVPVVYFGLVELPPLITPDPAYKDTFKHTHVFLNYVMAALVIIHILAALWHQFVQRDHLLLRILPRIGKSDDQ
jgi:cytochrome b561